MGIFSLPKSHQSPSALESTGVATLVGVQVSLTLLEKLMDGTSIPFVKGVTGAALEIIKMAKAIQSDSDDCSNLMKRTTSLMIVILDSLKGKIEGEIPDYLKLAIERLSRNFHEVLDELKIIEKRVGKRSSTSIARGILYHFDNTEKLKGCSAKLDWAINEFQVTSKVDSCLKDLERHEELRQGQAELRKGQGVLQEGQEKLQDDLADIRKTIKEKVNANAPLRYVRLSLPRDVL
ncbi:hypothetical protein FRC03_003592 [Tulasnella sp. 419]|nr:hypothetical protein FRC03_003592 [Tulasnella sp. 419]